MIGIYKITNQLNNKFYIGQSVHIETRWAEHCQPGAQSKIAQAIKEYGKENFTFEVLEECSVTELDQKENYYIALYNALGDNGYNVAEQNTVAHTTYLNIKKSTVLEIIQDLKNTQLSIVELGKKYNLDKSTISRINNGIIHIQENENYPIREKISKQITAIPHTCKKCNTIINKNSVYCLKHYKEFLAEQSSIPSRETLKALIRNTSFVQIGKQYGVSDNAVRRWCDKYKLPRKVSDIKKYTEQEWELL